MIHETAFIHPKAHVEGAKIGARTKVWQFASVIRGTILGADCVVAAGACLDGPLFGDRCIISPGVDIGPGFLIGDEVFIGPNVVLANDAWPRTHKEGWDAEQFRNGLITVRVASGASIGANAVILPGLKIGERAMIAAGAVVTQDVPADYLCTRDGYVYPITSNPKRRMREAKP